MAKLSLEKHFLMWSDGVLFAFDIVEVLNVIEQQIDFNYATFTN